MLERKAHEALKGQYAAIVSEQRHYNSILEAFQMQTFLEAYELWETVTEDKPLAALLADPTLAQIKSNNEEKAKKSKVKSLMQNAVADTVIYKIMACKTAKEVECARNEILRMQTSKERLAS
uniref:Uncharacterized protein n=1 Tax=Solanum lycopersicum TaxID=4081 RepID=A0A3Q7GSR7_SOLLC